jgi:broad specificity phosphatase PhoE
MITIWFEPHGTSLDNEASLASGWNDVDLSELGFQQSKDLVDRCLKRGIDSIFVSDMQRALKTVLPFAEQTQVPIFVDKRLRECDYGELTQHPKKEIDDLKIMHISSAFPGGESYRDCAVRIQEFLKELKLNFDNKTILIVGHRATQYGIENFVNKKALDESVTEKWQWQPGWKYTY